MSYVVKMPVGVRVARWLGAVWGLLAIAFYVAFGVPPALVLGVFGLTGAAWALWPKLRMTEDRLFIRNLFPRSYPLAEIDRFFVTSPPGMPLLPTYKIGISFKSGHQQVSRAIWHRERFGSDIATCASLEEVTSAVANLNEALAANSSPR